MRWEWWRRGTVQVANSHLQGGGKGDSRGAEATRSSDLGLMEVVVGGIGRGGRGGCRCQGWGSSWCCCCWGAGAVFSQLSVRTALLRLGWEEIKHAMPFAKNKKKVSLRSMLFCTGKVWMQALFSLGNKPLKSQRQGSFQGHKQNNNRILCPTRKQWQRFEIVRLPHNFHP